MHLNWTLFCHSLNEKLECKNAADMNVLLLFPKFPAETFWNIARSLRRFSRYRVDMPPLGLLTLASYMPADFHLRPIDRNLAEETAPPGRAPPWLLRARTSSLSGCYQNTISRGRRLLTRGHAPAYPAYPQSDLRLPLHSAHLLRSWHKKSEDSELLHAILLK